MFVQYFGSHTVSYKDFRETAAAQIPFEIAPSPSPPSLQLTSIVGGGGLVLFCPNQQIKYSPSIVICDLLNGSPLLPKLLRHKPVGSPISNLRHRGIKEASLRLIKHVHFDAAVKKDF